MCRWLAYSGGPRYLEDFVIAPEHSLIRQSLHANRSVATTNGDGFGIGWYGGRAGPGLFRETLPAWNDANLRSLCHQISSPLFFAHVRASTGTATSRDNCHPFRHGRWLFMHNGQIGGFPKLRRQLESLLPDPLYQTRLGSTDSELMFLLALMDGLAENPIDAFGSCLGRVEGAMEEAGTDEPLRVTAALSDGRRLFAFRHASDPNPPTLYWQEEPDGILIVSEPLDDKSGCWNEVPPDHALVIEAGKTADLVPFVPDRG